MFYTEAIKMLTGEEEIIRNISFSCYRDEYSSLSGYIADGCLKIDSYIDDDTYRSEKHYALSKENTAKLFSILTLNEFICMCREKNLYGMESFFATNEIKYDSIVV